MVLCPDSAVAPLQLCPRVQTSGYKPETLCTASLHPSLPEGAPVNAVSVQPLQLLTHLWTQQGHWECCCTGVKEDV